MVYVGSSLTPGRRVHNHLVTGHYSNHALQADIAKYELGKLTYYTLQEVEIPVSLSKDERKAYLLAAEQHYINKFPKGQLYNSNNSSVNYTEDSDSL